MGICWHLDKDGLKHYYNYVRNLRPSSDLCFLAKKIKLILILEIQAVFSQPRRLMTQSVLQ